MIIEFKILGEVKAKQRPRFARRGKFVQAYTPEQTVNYENLVKLSFQQNYGGLMFERDTPLELTVQAYRSIPKSFSKIKREKALSGELRPTTMPDIDNVIKLISDALDKVAYENDRQIVNVIGEKYYANEDYCVVKISEVKI